MKVFSKEKFIEVMGENIYKATVIAGQSWVDDCDNKEVVDNKIRCDELLNYEIKDEWCIEK